MDTPIKKEDFLKEGQDIVAKQAELEAEKAKNVADANAQENSDKNKGDEGANNGAAVAQTPEQIAEAEALKQSEAKKNWRDIEAEKVVAKQKDLELEKYNKTKANPLVNEFLQAVESGTVKEFINAMNEFDPKEVDDKTLYLKTLDGEDLTPEEKDESYESFLSQPKSLQKQVIEGKRAELAKAYEEKQKLWKVENPYLATAPKAIEEIESSIDALAGTDWNGVDVTPAIAANISETAKELYGAFPKKDGTYDVKKATEIAKAYHMGELAIAAAIKKASSDTTKNVIKKFVTPDAAPLNKGTNGGVTQMAQAQADLEALQQSRLLKFSNN